MKYAKTILIAYHGSISIGHISGAMGTGWDYQEDGRTRGVRLIKLSPNYKNVITGLKILINLSNQMLPKETTPGMGVSMLDAALSLNEGDLTISRETVDRWQKKRAPKRPADIGIDPKHSQIKLYEPNALVNFIRKSDGVSRYDYRKLRQELELKARKPRSNNNLQ